MVDMNNMMDELSNEEIQLAKDLARKFKEAGPQIVGAMLNHWPADSTDPHILFLREAAATYCEYSSLK